MTKASADKDRIERRPFIASMKLVLRARDSSNDTELSRRIAPRPFDSSALHTTINSAVSQNAWREKLNSRASPARAEVAAASIWPTLKKMVPALWVSSPAREI